MSNKSKKQALLGKTQIKQKKRSSNHKKNRAQTQQRPSSNVQSAQIKHSHNQAKAKNRKGNKLLITLIVLLVVLFLFPKPQLITYEKIGIVAKSIYWSGLPGIEPIIFDTKLHIRPALERDTLYLCMDKHIPDTCQKYKIVQKEGILSAIKFLISDKKN